MEETKAHTLTPFELITKGVAEIIGEDEIRQGLDERQLTIYWGTAPTKSPSLGYFIPLLKLKDCLDAGLNVKILLADIHSYLDKGSATIPHTQHRVDYYSYLLKEMLKCIGVDPDNIQFVQGSEVQLDRKYVLDLFALTTNISVTAAKKAGSEVVKQDKNPLVSSLLYPIMQVLDETVLNADIQLGGLDQRKIFALSRDYKESIGYKKCTYLMNNLLPSLSKPGSKMSSSDPNGKIELFDTHEIISAKLSKAYCVEKDTTLSTSPCLMLAKWLVFPILGSLGKYRSYEELIIDWEFGLLHANELKDNLSCIIWKIIEPIYEKLNEKPELYEKAFGKRV
jgi:tyrosyl-tRNA synthetase